MIESIPNPLHDYGVQTDIRTKTTDLMVERLGLRCSIMDSIEHLLKKAAEWGVSYGFRMGWRLAENRTVERMNRDFKTYKQVSEGTGKAAEGAEELLRKMCLDLASGGDIEEIADKYVKCETPELRQQLIDGLKSVLGKGGEV